MDSVGVVDVGIHLGEKDEGILEEDVDEVTELRSISDLTDDEGELAEDADDRVRVGLDEVCPIRIFDCVLSLLGPFSLRGPTVLEDGFILCREIEPFRIGLVHCSLKCLVEIVPSLSTLS